MGRAQHRNAIGRAQKQKARGVDAQFEQSQRGYLSVLQRGKILRKPQHTSFRRDVSGKRRHKTCGGRLIPRFDGEYLVEGSPADPAFQAGIRGPVTQSHPAMIFRPLKTCPGERNLEKSQLFRICAHGPARLEHIENEIKAPLAP